jgi:hypothetical protein
VLGGQGEHGFELGVSGVEVAKRRIRGRLIEPGVVWAAHFLAHFGVGDEQLEGLLGMNEGLAVVVRAADDETDFAGDFLRFAEQVNKCPGRDRVRSVPLTGAGRTGERVFGVVEPAGGGKAAVLDALDDFDELTHDRPELSRSGPGVAATVRALLGPHWRKRNTGYCAGCPEEVEPAWPCPAWRAAYRWIVELDPLTGNRYEDEWYLMPQP